MQVDGKLEMYSMSGMQNSKTHLCSFYIDVLQWLIISFIKIYIQNEKKKNLKFLKKHLTLPAYVGLGEIVF